MLPRHRPHRPSRRPVPTRRPTLPRHRQNRSRNRPLRWTRLHSCVARVRRGESPPIFRRTGRVHATVSRSETACLRLWHRDRRWRWRCRTRRSDCRPRAMKPPTAAPPGTRPQGSARRESSPGGGKHLLHHRNRRRTRNTFPRRAPRRCANAWGPNRRCTSPPQRRRCTPLFEGREPNRSRRTPRSPPAGGSPDRAGTHVRGRRSCPNSCLPVRRRHLRYFRHNYAPWQERKAFRTFHPRRGGRLRRPRNRRPSNWRRGTHLRRRPSGAPLRIGRGDRDKRARSRARHEPAPRR